MKRPGDQNVKCTVLLMLDYQVGSPWPSEASSAKPLSWSCEHGTDGLNLFVILHFQPMQFKLDPRLARLLGVHTQTRPVIINSLWNYIKTHKLQDAHEREFINCDRYLNQVGFLMLLRLSWNKFEVSHGCGVRFFFGRAAENRVAFESPCCRCHCCCLSRSDFWEPHRP